MDKAAAKATAGVPPAIDCASQHVFPASADTAAAEATNGMPSAMFCAFQPIFIARRGTTAFHLKVLHQMLIPAQLLVCPKRNSAFAQLFLRKIVFVSVFLCLLCFLMTECSPVKWVSWL